jgi:hypothetical protein
MALWMARSEPWVIKLELTGEPIIIHLRISLKSYPDSQSHVLAHFVRSRDWRAVLWMAPVWMAPLHRWMAHSEPWVTLLELTGELIIIHLRISSINYLHSQSHVLAL